MKMTRREAATTALAWLLIAGATIAPAAAEQVWKVQTSMSAGESFYTNIEQHWLPRLKEMTGGELQIELTPVGSVVPYNETMDAIGQGILQGDITATVYFSGRSKAFALLGDLIAGYERPDQIGMFCYHGGGQELLQETFDTYADGNVKVVGCGAIARESFTSKVPIRGIEDLKGVKVRSPEGLAATVFERAGASPVALPSSEVYTSLDKGVIDASDFSSYTMDESIGLHEIAKFPIYPGIHSMPVIQFTVNKAAWESLTPAQQTILDVWYRAMIDDLAMINELTDRELVARDKSDASAGVEVIDWAKEDRDQLRQIAAEAWADFAEGDELAKRAYEANLAFMKKLGLL
jgi:TRAP-type mannitol/chloroaromatic compound transport system substrate-binding protein